MAQTLYATPTDVQQLGIPSNATAAVAASITAQITRASADIDSYLASRYTLPLTSWGPDLTGICVDIVVYRLLRLRGFNPEDGVNVAIYDGYKQALVALRDIATGRRTLQVVVTAPQADELPAVYTDCPRDLQRDDPSSDSTRLGEFYSGT